MLYGTETWAFPLLKKAGVVSVYRFIAFMVIFVEMVLFHWKKRKMSTEVTLVIAWLVPAWFHLFLFVCLWFFALHLEQTWLTVAAFMNLIMSVILHCHPLYKRLIQEH